MLRISEVVTALNRSPAVGILNNFSTSVYLLVF